MTRRSSLNSTFARAASMIAATFVAAGAIANDPVMQARDSKIIRLSDLIVEILPIGTALEQLATRTEYWPLKVPPSKDDVPALGCLRKKLSSAHYRQIVQEQVGKFSLAHPNLVEPTIALLETEGGEILRKLFREAGAHFDSEQRFMFDVFTNDMSSVQLALANSLLFGGENRSLRMLLGLVGRIDVAASPKDSQRLERNIIVSIRQDFVARQTEGCPRIRGEFLLPSELRPNNSWTYFYRIDPPSKVATLKPKPRERKFDVQCGHSLNPDIEFAIALPLTIRATYDPKNLMTVGTPRAEINDLGLKGTVLIEAKVTEKGQVAGVALEKSSGFRKLDSIALDAARWWRLRPAMIEGVPVCSRVVVPVIF